MIQVYRVPVTSYDILSYLARKKANRDIAARGTRAAAGPLSLSRYDAMYLGTAARRGAAALSCAATAVNRMHTPCT